jgi:hypothetical protein
VLVENQLERTDHLHLGQLLTYAAGLKAVTIVWVAERFTEEHRAALDWLNEITGEQFAFFGLEIELWRIGESRVAPKFNIVCQPNDWSKAVSEAAEGEVSDTKLLQQEYWTALRDLLLERQTVLRPQKPRPQHWTNFSIGRSNFDLYAAVNSQKNVIQTGIYCSGRHAKPHFHLLKRQRDEIEKELGWPLEWVELPGGNDSRIRVRKEDQNPANKADWRAQHEWVAAKLEALYRAFSRRIKELDVEDYRPSDGEQSH